MINKSPEDLAMYAITRQAELEAVLSGFLTTSQAAGKLGITPERVRQLAAFWREGSPAGLPHIRTPLGMLIPLWTIQTRLANYPKESEK